MAIYFYVMCYIGKMFDDMVISFFSFNISIWLNFTVPSVQCGETESSARMKRSNYTCMKWWRKNLFSNNLCECGGESQTCRIYRWKIILEAAVIGGKTKVEKVHNLRDYRCSMNHRMIRKQGLGGSKEKGLWQQDRIPRWGDVCYRLGFTEYSDPLCPSWSPSICSEVP